MSDLRDALEKAKGISSEIQRRKPLVHDMRAKFLLRQEAQKAGFVLPPVDAAGDRPAQKVEESGDKRSEQGDDSHQLKNRMVTNMANATETEKHNGANTNPPVPFQQDMAKSAGLPPGFFVRKVVDVGEGIAMAGIGVGAFAVCCVIAKRLLLKDLTVTHLSGPPAA